MSIILSLGIIYSLNKFVIIFSKKKKNEYARRIFAQLNAKEIEKYS